MTEQPEHPPTPFTLQERTQEIVDADGCVVASVRAPGMADFILRACNSHEKLVKACRRAAGFFDSQRIGTIVMPGSVIHDLRAGLTAAEGEPHE